MDATHFVFTPFLGRVWSFTQLFVKAPALAQGRQDLVDLHVPKAAVLRVVCDHRHPPTPGALEATLPPADAGRIVRQLECPDPPHTGAGSRWPHARARWW